MSGSLFRGDKSGSPNDDRGFAASLCRIDRFFHCPKIDEHRHAITRPQNDIVGFNISVDDVAAVDKIEYRQQRRQ